MENIMKSPVFTCFMTLTINDFFFSKYDYKNNSTPV
jgi:hypothetical protein